MDLWWHAEGGDWRDPLTRQRLPTDLSNCYINQLQNFVDVISGVASPVISARDGMMSLAATLAIAQSAATGKAVQVSEMIQQALMSK
jgi:predicted dehydrogenase